MVIIIIIDKADVALVGCYSDSLQCYGQLTRTYYINFLNDFLLPLIGTARQVAGLGEWRWNRGGKTCLKRKAAKAKNVVRLRLLAKAVSVSKTTEEVCSLYTDVQWSAAFRFTHSLHVSAHRQRTKLNRRLLLEWTARSPWRKQGQGGEKQMRSMYLPIPSGNNG